MERLTPRSAALRLAIRRILDQPQFISYASPEAYQCAQRASQIMEQWEWLAQ